MLLSNVIGVLFKNVNYIWDNIWGFIWCGEYGVEVFCMVRVVVEWLEWVC